MEIKKFKLSGKNSTELETEIKFHTASAKATNSDIFCIFFNANESKNSEARNAAISKILRAEKRAGKIQLFVFAGRISEQTTETAYLLNKYPNIVNAKFDDNSYIVKI